MQRVADQQFWGHPRALSTLFFAELWERFSYYGMRALLVLFLVQAVAGGGFGLDDRTAAAIYGLYTAGVYIASVPGGWIADRLLGAQRAVLWGGIIIALGHLLLALAGTLTAFCTGLAVIVVGTGLLKPNIAALVGALYPEGGARRDAGFTVFYMGINVGAMIGPLATGALAQRYGWGVGFGAAALGMAVGVVWFVMTRARLAGAGAEPTPHPQGQAGTRRDLRRVLWVGVLLLALALLFASGVTGVSALQLRGATVWLILAFMAAGFGQMLLGSGLNREERGRVAWLLVLCAASSVFWSGFEQAGSSLTLFAERFTQRDFAGWVLPTSWFQSLNSIFIIVFAPLFSALWLSLGKRGRDLSSGGKFVLALLAIAASFVVMAGASRLVAGGALAGPGWLVATYLLHTWGELALSPVGMSAATQLVPARYAGQAMGLWYGSLSLGSLVASLFAGEFDTGNLAAMPGQYLHISLIQAVAAAVLVLLLWLWRRETKA
jgi:proton-dependent oligopeptide transporter, POT family